MGTLVVVELSLDRLECRHLQREVRGAGARPGSSASTAGVGGDAGCSVNARHETSRRGGLLVGSVVPPHTLGRGAGTSAPHRRRGSSRSASNSVLACVSGVRYGPQVSLCRAPMNPGVLSAGLVGGRTRRLNGMPRRRPTKPVRQLDRPVLCRGRRAESTHNRQAGILCMERKYQSYLEGLRVRVPLPVVPGCPSGVTLPPGAPPISRPPQPSEDAAAGSLANDRYPARALTSRDPRGCRPLGGERRGGGEQALASRTNRGMEATRPGRAGEVPEAVRHLDAARRRSAPRRRYPRCEMARRACGASVSIARTGPGLPKIPPWRFRP